MSRRTTSARPVLPADGDARIRRVRPGDWRPYHRRALETLHAVQHSAQSGEWSAVIAIAPVSALATAQAVVARQANVLSRPDDYNTAVELLLIHGTGLPGIEEAIADLRHLLERKIAVQHGAEPASEEVGTEIMESTTRFVEWADRQLTGHRE